MITATRYHDFSAGHRVVGHENKCRHIHGHNYRVHFTIAPREGHTLDSQGRVLDFGAIKTLFCDWLEMQWDHKLLLWSQDPLLGALSDLIPDDIAVVTFNPTAENMAQFLLHCNLFKLREVELVRVKVEETRKCWAVANLFPI